jgi:hypothetical protein
LGEAAMAEVLPMQGLALDDQLIVKFQNPPIPPITKVPPFKLLLC